MLKSLAKNKSVLLAILLIILVFFVYNSFFKTDLANFTLDQSVKNIGADIVKTYSNLQSVTLDQKLFSSPGYINLADFSVSISSQPVGRTNPFDLIGRD
ncbi:MAG: hypothetical protein AAB690_02385 [Patescibacteria group bacterium]